MSKEKRSSEIINATWKLVIEQGYSRAAAARKLGLAESRVDRILQALHARRRKLAAPRRRSAHMPCAVVLEDDPAAAELIEVMFGMNGIHADVVRATSREDFVRALDSHHVDVVISDSSVVGIKPLRALHLAKQRHPASAFFILSGRVTPAQAAIARNAGVNASIDKKAIEKLVPLVKQAIELRVRKPSGQAEDR